MAMRAALLLTMLAGVMLPGLALLWWSSRHPEVRLTLTTLLVAQSLLSAAPIAWVLQARLLAPIARLKRLASAKARAAIACLMRCLPSCNCVTPGLPPSAPFSRPGCGARFPAG